MSNVFLVIHNILTSLVPLTKPFDCTLYAHHIRFSQLQWAFIAYLSDSIWPPCTNLASTHFPYTSDLHTLLIKRSQLICSTYPNHFKTFCFTYHSCSLSHHLCTSLVHFSIYPSLSLWNNIVRHIFLFHVEQDFAGNSMWLNSAVLVTFTSQKCLVSKLLKIRFISYCCDSGALRVYFFNKISIQYTSKANLMISTILFR